MNNAYEEIKLSDMGSPDLYGRRVIYVSVPKEGITRENLADIVSKIMPVHEKNAAECDYLYKYAKGRQPIKMRTKKIRSDINNKVCENHALEILTFKVGYTFGEPVQFVLYGDCDVHDPDKKNDERMTAYNELLRADNKNSKDKSLGNWIFACGVGYRMCLPSKPGASHPFDTFVLDPRQTWVAVADDYTEEPVLCGYCNRNRSKYDIYSKSKHWTLELDVSEDGVVDYTSTPKITEKPNLLERLPIVQYKANDQMQGCFEVVLDSCDALNKIESNALDSIEQFVQAFIWFNNCDVDEDKVDKLKGFGAISTSSPPGVQAQIKIMSESLDQEQTSTFKENIYQSMLTIAAVPDRRASAGGNTGQALIIGEGWIMAESAAKDFENIYKLSERQFIDLSLEICHLSSATPVKMSDLALADIDIHFTRRMTDNLLVKTQALMNMLQAGVHPRHAFKICGLFNDPEQAYMDSLPYLAKYIAGEGDGSELLQAADNNSPIASDLLDAMIKLKDNLDKETLDNGNDTEPA